MRFKLNNQLHAGKCNDDIIILDLKKDTYISITDIAARALQASLEEDLILENGQYRCASVDQQWGIDESDIVAHLLSEKIIEISELSYKSFKLPSALRMGGLSNYKWDYKASMTSFSSTPKLTILQAYYSLLKVEYQLKKNGIKGVLNLLEKAYYPTKHYKRASDEEIKLLSDSVDVACALYPKKIYCLGWASTFTLLALRKGIKAQLVIGVQNMPFYAHAWSEIDGKVINDDERVNQYLTTLLTYPEK